MNSLRTTYHKLIPTELRELLWVFRQRITLLIEYSRDIKRYHFYSGFRMSSAHPSVLQSEIMIDYHRLEKGMALASPRPGFGREVTLRLMNNINRFLATEPPNFIIHDALSTLDAYIDHQKQRAALAPEIQPAYDALRAQITHCCSGSAPLAVKDATRAEIQPPLSFDYQQFFRSRRSIRNFAANPVSPSLLKKVVELAQTAPSVCNRQAGRVHAITRPEQVATMAKLQKGCTGFSESVPVMLIVTVDLRRFVTNGERNQPWIDGGIFLMNLLLAVHAVGLGGCCLNWCSGRSTDRLLRREINLPEHESVIAMVAVGHLPEAFRVAKASRLPLEEVLSFY